ncbi:MULTISPECIES: FAD-binding oxidoreductase [Paraburkholderia]|uniref:NAD(P)/FAD-dependent oxidoreductase n=1 Tax=Paraburkholderia TaxID=1822464 RepID=UPI00224F112E|nr:MULTISPECIES: FAD-binding oxidoreductase [Paraburkholderia]MCX4162355.1 FAD-binding oxidoreductase [Paraburkholderia megapolitana]MDN7157850.1 FAD-binding oxidoreductase [Paraburkholderia sp. CHISQ3]MDQ6494897.1 FAD-binding oxidoreductase [Paraburkholderia megapolitana]
MGSHTIADAIVVGAGIVGAACAAELAACGLRVDVIDAQGIGGGATAAGMGHLVVMNDSPAEFALTRYARALWLARAPELRARDAFVRCGTLWVAADDEEWRAALAMHEAFASQGVAGELLDAAALRACEPALAPGMAGGLRITDDSIVYAPTAAQWLLEASPSAAKIRVRTGAEVVAVDAEGVTLANGEHVRGARVIVANGSGARRLVPSVPLRPKKGHLLITDRYPGLIRHQLLELGYIKSAHHATGTSVAFNAQPRPTGQLLLGSSRQFDTTDPAVEMPVLAQMLRRAARYLPGLPTLNGLRAWTGFRAASPDGLPLIGPAGDAAPGVWLAVGHEGLGVTTSLATAKLLAAQILRTDPPIPVAPYLPQRFAPAHDGPEMETLQ